MQIVTINKNDAGQRLDKFIAKAFPNMPKSMIHSDKENKAQQKARRDIGYPRGGRYAPAFCKRGISRDRREKRFFQEPAPAL